MIEISYHMMGEGLSMSGISKMTTNIGENDD